MLSPHKSSHMALAAVILVIFTIGTSQAQENIQLQIPPSLVECYNTTYFMNRDNRLPSNIGTLITLIEKAENAYGYTGDIRTMAVSLLHRFRQDGIQRAQGVPLTEGVMPYSPIGFQFPKFRILLSRLIPGNAYTFPNSSLTREERCSLHFMLSSSFDTRVRGDEGQVCGKISQYRAQRLVRSISRPQANNFVGDIEILDNFPNSNKNRAIPKKFVQANYNGRASEYDYGWGNVYDYDTNNDNTISSCPVENGVMYTPWGTVAAGTLIAGIAAGLQPQNVQLRTLLALSRRPGGPSLPQTATVTIDNRWASTLAGDLAEVALVQVPITPSETASVGGNGAWNSTVMPKWYFLNQRQNLEMTDAEIRGGLDGLIIAMNIANWRTQASTLKLSQLLRMYYSMTGVLNSGIMACNRKDNAQNFAPLNQMIPQTSAFAQVLDREMQLRVTLTPEAIANFSSLASNALTNYIPQYLNDLSCSVSNALPQDVSQSITAMTNIYVFLDTSWQYNTIVDYVMYILQNLNINPYASTVTLLAASDGSIMVNTTNDLDVVYQTWNVTNQTAYTPGFSLPNVLRTVQNLTQAYMNVQRSNSSVGGYSMVALMIPNQNTISGTDSSYATTQLQYIYEQIPDLYFIYYGGGSVNGYQAFVRNPNTDIFPLSTGSNPATSANPVVMRIKKTVISWSCLDTTELGTSQDVTNTTTIITDIVIFLDTTWVYNYIVDYVNYVVQRLNINPYESSITLRTASDGSVIVNKTNYIAEFYEKWNATTHLWHSPGFSLPKVLNSAREFMEDIMQYDRNASSMGGQSLIALIIPSPIAFLSENDYWYCRRYIDFFNRTMPDLHFIYYGGGAVIRFMEFVSNPHEDLFPLSFDMNIREASLPVVQRLKRVPRRIVNPRCGSNGNSLGFGSNQLVQYVRLGDINFYRMTPQYFFYSGSMRYLKIQLISSITFLVCTSRSIILPHRVGNSDPQEISCSPLTSTAFSYDLTDSCEGYDTVQACPPLYFSIKAQNFADVTQVSCKANACETPDQAQYLIFVNNLICRNGVAGMLSSGVALFTLTLLLLLTITLV